MLIMHKFWYHSPVRFYKTEEELSDMTNPQNCQFFGAKNPYPLEKGAIHRFLIPNVDNGVVNPNNFKGRNLVKQSNKFNAGLANNGITTSVTTEGYLQVISTSGNGNWHRWWSVNNTGIEEHFNDGDLFTITFWVKRVSGTGIPSIYIKNGLEYLPLSGDLNSTDFKPVSYTGIWKKANAINPHLGWSETNGTFQISKWKLEKGTIPTDWSPAHEDEDYETNLKLFLVGDTEQEIQSLMTVIDNKLCAVTFKCDDFVQGHFEIRNYTEPVFYSNCVKFIDSTDSEGRKYIRIATKHNYDKNLFPYSKSPNLYCVTNLPAYDLGRFTAEVDAKNNRVGNSASLISSESYTDETVQYEFKAYGDANILSFIQVHAVNNEFYINGTQRTAIDKMEADEFAMIGKLKFTNVKDNLGLNKTISEDNIFDDLDLKIIEFTPAKGYTDAHNLYSGLIKFRFNSEVYYVGDNTKAVYLYRVESGAPDSIWVSKGFLDFVVDGDTVIFNVGSLPPGEFYMIIDDNLFKNSFGDVFNGINSKTEWAFTMTDLPITPEISISWVDGTNTDLSGILTSVILKIESEVSSPSNPPILFQWERSIDGINYTQFAVGISDQNVTLNNIDNFFRLKITLQDTTEIYSNVLKYTKETIPTTNYYFQAVHPYNYPGNDFVRYIDQYGNEQMEVLIRSHWENLDGDDALEVEEWIEAPCMLIQANQILETQGAISCTP